MRTTLTIDDHVAARLRRLAAGRGAQKRLINDLLRMELDRMEHREASEGPPFRTATHRLVARFASTPAS
jgi:metal-responsive CopG/Arc/MetJ family transcriptional regulator